MVRRSTPTYRNKSEQIAEALLARIIADGMKPGDVLGTEADLVAEHDVSRPTLRESLRMLEAQGVVSLRPGPGGGVTVGKPSVESLAHALSVFLYLQGVPFQTVLKAREVIEPALAFEAAKGGTDAEFDEMQASIERMRGFLSEAGFIAENRSFHRIIARASRNAVLESFWEAISLLAAGEQQPISYTSRNRVHVLKAHEEILVALRDRDPATAAARMAAHVGELEHLVQRRSSANPGRTSAAAIGYGPA